MSSCILLLGKKGVIYSIPEIFTQGQYLTCVLIQVKLFDECHLGGI